LLGRFCSGCCAIAVEIQMISVNSAATKVRALSIWDLIDWLTDYLSAPRLLGSRCELKHPQASRTSLCAGVRSGKNLDPEARGCNAVSELPSPNCRRWDEFRFSSNPEGYQPVRERSERGKVIASEGYQTQGD